jgi:hypothetical protein
MNEVYLNIFPVEILDIIFRHLIIYLDVNTLTYISNINQKYRKIIMNNIDIKDFKDIFEEKEYKTNIIEAKYKNNLDYLIKNTNFLLKKINNEYTFICFFDNILKTNNYNIKDNIKYIVSYFVMHKHWVNIKNIYLISLKNYDIMNKDIEENKYLSFIKVINNYQHKFKIKGILEINKGL